MARLTNESFKCFSTLDLKLINELSDVDRKIESETRTQLQKGLLEKINEIKNTLRTRDAS